MWYYIAIIFGTLLAVIAALQIRTNRRNRIIIFVTLGVCFCLAQSLAYYYQPENDTSSEETGMLVGPEDYYLAPEQNIYPIVRIGNSNSTILNTNPEGEIAFSFFKDIGLKIWIENGEMKLSVKIRDRDGDLVAEIIGNEWNIRSDKRWDRNYNWEALEVRDPSGDVVLQVVMEPTLICFAAKMFTSDGEGFMLASEPATEQDVALYQQKGISYEVGEHIAFVQKASDPPSPPFHHTLEPIFRYPGDRHLGELVSE